MEMPRELADLLGIVLDEKKPAAPKKAPARPGLGAELTDGIVTLTYDGSTMGWVNKIRTQTKEGKIYRALSVHGEVRHFYSLEAAKEFICSRYN
jgi:hypothetical protein